MADGKVVISTALDNSGIEKDSKQLQSSLKSQAMKLAHEYKKQGMSMSDAMKKAYAELGVAGKQASDQAGKSIQGGIGGSADIAISKLGGLTKAVAGTLGGLTKVVAGVTASIAAAFGAAAVAITKQAVDAYADYEQLIGGVETLFKDAADKVAGYAEDAFYTVGISANEYMETVTSFSASLISSLAGDTAKAADVANMALTDMADNANKMGTPLESIKTAYQGFAKQNYTMLDNLKLGYGGTKTEMERLLKDAQKLTGVKYDINNLADVYNAIHAVQVELGIAGTTAKEAEKTITGSANMTKAAWKNVLVAISGGGDLDRAINNLVFSLSKYFDNLTPVVERSLTGIGELIERVAPQLVETVAAALIKAIPSLLNAVYQMIIGLANGVYQGIVALLSGSTKQIEAQLNSTDKLADGYNDAADGASNLADATEEAGKAAKKSLAPFDEITKLSGKDSNEEAAGGVIGGAVSGGGVTPEVPEANTQQIAGPIVAVIEKVKKKIGELLAPLMNINFRPLINSLKPLGKAFMDLGKTIADALEWAWFEVLTPLAEWGIEEAAPAAVDTLSSAFDALSAALEPVYDGIQVLWEDLDPFISFIEEKAIAALRDLKDQFDHLGQVFSSRGNEIRNIFSGIGEIFAVVWAKIEPILNAMWTKWSTIFSSIGRLISDEVGNIIDFLSGLVDFIAGGVFTGDWSRAWNGLKNMVKAPINSIIGFINTMVSGVVAGVNAIIDMVNSLSFDVPDWVPGIGGKTFGFDLQRVTPPQIPYLAKGAVLPPNKPFMAVVGDQTHGTNVEAPLATIQEAVAIVMEDMIQSNIAGHEATVAVLREILEAVLGIHIGDDVIGEAVARYNAKLAIIKGGA